MSGHICPILRKRYFASYLRWDKPATWFGWFPRYQRKQAPTLSVLSPIIPEWLWLEGQPLWLSMVTYSRLPRIMFRQLPSREIPKPLWAGFISSAGEIKIWLLHGWEINIGRTGRLQDEELNLSSFKLHSLPRTIYLKLSTASSASWLCSISVTNPNS